MHLSSGGVDERWANLFPLVSALFIRLYSSDDVAQ
jgi:hypothetical protein